MHALVALNDQLIALTRRASRYVAWSLGMLLLATIAFIVAAILMRKFAGLALHGVEEYSGYMLAILSSWGLAYTLYEKANIRIDIAHNRLPAAGRATLDVIALFSLTFVSLVISWYAWPVLDKSLSNNSLANTSLATPLWIPQLVWFAGYVWFSFVSVVLSLRVILAVLQKDAGRIDALAGIEPDLPADDETTRDPAASGQSRS
ncbi:TRAP transporter small permease subunit [Marinobacterium mangrovicola]|uniref:TRAP transporter small permease protein n=1 Tax=Marinobacterium mangrovicola TaxID=1476959 RepID=A0A4R1G7L7_9GAMM|nr:TRAP transporter small permease [Marinobacterium mangrovicola]TCK03558.1 TRAP-type mannitol/chloroaromatic compound transport system permease small subunit [Marinobacterium mangrovicola]